MAPSPQLGPMSQSNIQTTFGSDNLGQESLEYMDTLKDTLPTFSSLPLPLVTS
jgi:hypothetical protein